MFALFLLLITLCVHLTTQQTCDFEKLEVVTDFTPNACYERSIVSTKTYYYYLQESCLPHCKLFTSGAPGSCTTTTCVPGYICDSKQKCVQDLTSCALYYVPYASNNYYKTVFRPTCNFDFSWAPKQCKGEATTGRCFCYDAGGKRVFGQAWRTDAADMTCACSRKKADLRAQGLKYYVSLHCDSMGNYEPLQCDAESEMCWCADNKTGDVTSPVVPESAMNRLPCYDAVQIGSQYMRVCDSTQFARAKILNELNIHGTTGAAFAPLFCDEDGGYGSYRISDGIAYCTWRDNSNIKTWQSPATEDLTLLNCNCARDSVIYQESGQALTQQCLGNGNYDPFQKIGTIAYCVDSDGFKKSTDANPPNDANACQSML